MVVGLSLCVGCKTSQVKVSAFLHGPLSLCSYVVPKLDKIIPGLAGLSWSESLWIPLVVKHGHEHLPFIDYFSPLKYPSMRSMREFPLLFDYQRVHIAVFCPYPECGSKTASRCIPSPSSWGVKWMSPKRTGGIAKTHLKRLRAVTRSGIAVLRSFFMWYHQCWKFLLLLMMMMMIIIIIISVFPGKQLGSIPWHPGQGKLLVGLSWDVQHHLFATSWHKLVLLYDLCAGFPVPSYTYISFSIVIFM